MKKANKPRICDFPKCRTHCPTWNREDNDCDIYGLTHPSPMKCPFYPYKKEAK